VKIPLSFWATFITSKWKHVQFRDDRMSPTGADGPGFESFRIADHYNIWGDFPHQWKLGFSWSWGVGSQSISGAALNLSQLAHLLLWIWHPHGSLSWGKRCLPLQTFLLSVIKKESIIVRSTLEFNGRRESFYDPGVQ
jgi:hypothetical protein